MMKINKSQSLVTFLLLLPFLLILFGFIVDYGMLSIEKRKTDNVVKDNIEYGLQHIEEDKTIWEQNIRIAIRQNIEDIEVLEIVYGENYVDILLSKHYSSLYSIMMGQSIYKIESHYRGYIDDGKITLVKE